MNDFFRASTVGCFPIFFGDDTPVLIEGQNYNNFIFMQNSELKKISMCGYKLGIEYSKNILRNHS